MRTIGILGGMAAPATLLYYQRLNAQARARLGGLHQADLLIRSLDFAEIARMQMAGEWEAAGALLHREAQMLEAGGAGLLIMATNTMHRVADRVTLDLRIPFLHIADATAAAVLKAGHARPGVLSTRFVLEDGFYLERLREAGLEPVLPDEADMAEVHRIIYDELCRDIVHAASRDRLAAVANSLRAAGADCLVLACTDLGLAITDETAPLPLFDSTLIHCDQALEAALA